MDEEDGVCVCVHEGILLSHKKEWHDAICSNVDGLTDYHIKWSESERDKYNMISLVCGLLRYNTNESIYKTETDSTDIEKSLMVAKGGERGIDWEYGFSRCKLLYLE